MYAAKEAGGNPKSTKSHAKVDEAVTQTLEKAGGETDLISGTHLCVCEERDLDIT